MNLDLDYSNGDHFETFFTRFHNEFNTIEVVVVDFDVDVDVAVVVSFVVKVY